YRRTPARGARRSGPAQLRGKALYACSLEEERRYAAEGAEQRGREPASRPARALVGRGERGRRRVRAPLSLATSLLVDARPGLCRPVRAPLPAGASVLAGRCEGGGRVCRRRTTRLSPVGGRLWRGARAFCAGCERKPLTKSPSATERHRRSRQLRGERDSREDGKFLGFGVAARVEPQKGRLRRPSENTSRLPAFLCNLALLSPAHP